jgi:hypothetical protein
MTPFCEIKLKKIRDQLDWQQTHDGSGSVTVTNKLPVELGNQTEV